ncbi:SENP1 [Mytilus coruscus]|uniref:SENP1 n=1 Tax=Mytilus coruscus TaxID=42192 RepID=A0A6J8B5G8_MYTCO|nr:SENP1 [Mytilus coruscus]
MDSNSEEEESSRSLYNFLQGREVDVNKLKGAEDNVVEFIQTLSDGFENDLICRKNRYCLRKGDFKTIVERKWLNDEIINYYLNLLENDRTKSLDVFFYSTLKKIKAIAVERLVKAEVINFDMILVPINVSNHWILCHTPQQSNCNDCGVYLCHFAALLSVRQPVSFDSVSIHAVKNSNIYPFN